MARKLSGQRIGLNTELVVGGRRPEWVGRLVNPPVSRGSTHVFADIAAFEDSKRHNADGHTHYGRRGAEAQWALAEALTQLEPGAEGTMLYSSGLAAIGGALLSCLKPGDVLLMTDNAYEPTRALARGFLADWGVETRWFDPTDLASAENAICTRTAAMLLESPGSLTLEVQDVPALCKLAKARNITTVLDNSWATPLGFRAHDHGVDLSVIALTKHVGGHSDLMMGSVSAAPSSWKKLRQVAQTLGHCVSPDDAWLALRGMRTLSLRLKRSAETALAIAQWLETRAEVARVLHPALSGSPGHELWQRDFSGSCGLLTFVLKGRDKAARARFVDALNLFGIGFSWGGYESLALPVDPGVLRTASPWPLAGMADADCLAIRLGIGLEDADDLIADLEQGFSAMDAL